MRPGLIQLSGSPVVQWLQNGKRYSISSGDILTAMQNAGVSGWNWSLISTVRALPGTAAPVFIGTAADSNGLLLKQSGDSNVYLIQDGRRRLFASVEALNWYGADWLPHVIDVAPAIFASYTIGDGKP